ncbi:MAG: hypothetical protein ACSHXH_06145 [Marivita sp.]|uniref:hypothetical protein n=1 Tax=Marivita sp. TaxID=2003365 RepID=UPI003EF246AB
MTKILHQDIRIGDVAIKVGQDFVSTCDRVRTEVFQNNLTVRCNPDSLTEALDAVSDRLPAYQMVDVIFDFPIDRAECSDTEKRVISGWTVFKAKDTTQIKIRDLFSKEIVTVDIKYDILDTVIAALRRADLTIGRLFFALPGLGFRYSVHCNYREYWDNNQLVDDIDVSFVVGLPRFTGPDRAEISAKNRNAVKRRVHPRHQIAEPQNISADVSHTQSSAALNVPILTRQPISATSKITQMDQKLETWEKGEPDRNVLSNRELNHVDWDSSNQQTKAPCAAVEREFDLTLVILLDAKVDTAIAATAYLAKSLGSEVPITEIGLWRKKFKSAFQRFGSVSEIFELKHLPITRKVHGEMTSFLRSLKIGEGGSDPVIVIGEEFLNPVTATDIADILCKIFPKISLVVFGQSDLALSDHWDGIMKFSESAKSSKVKLGSESWSSSKMQTDQKLEVRRFQLPLHSRQKILHAERNGLLGKGSADLWKLVLIE